MDSYTIFLAGFITGLGVAYIVISLINCFGGKNDKENKKNK